MQKPDFKVALFMSAVLVAVLSAIIFTHYIPAGHLAVFTPNALGYKLLGPSVKVIKGECYAFDPLRQKYSVIPEYVNAEFKILSRAKDAVLVTVKMKVRGKINDTGYSIMMLAPERYASTEMVAERIINVGMRRAVHRVMAAMTIRQMYDMGPGVFMDKVSKAMAKEFIDLGMDIISIEITEAHIEKEAKGA